MGHGKERKGISGAGEDARPSFVVEAEAVDYDQYEQLGIGLITPDYMITLADLRLIINMCSVQSGRITNLSQDVERIAEYEIGSGQLEAMSVAISNIWTSIISLDAHLQTKGSLTEQQATEVRNHYNQLEDQRNRFAQMTAGMTGI